MVFFRPPESPGEVGGTTFSRAKVWHGQKFVPLGTLPKRWRDPKVTPGGHPERTYFRSGEGLAPLSGIQKCIRIEVFER